MTTRTRAHPYMLNMVGRLIELRPGELVIFTVPCLAPVEKAKYLKLALPSLAVASEEKFQFNVPLKPEPLPAELQTDGGMFNWFPRWDRILFKQTDYQSWIKKFEDQRKRR